MNPIPIETVYKGYKFRSRLEARWAVFFDSLGIKWEYEKEGYKLKHGWYLPDFWLLYQHKSEYPNSGEWVEIKGQKITKKEEQLALDLSISTKHSTNIIHGPPWNIEEHFKTHNKGFNNYLLIDTIDPLFETFCFSCKFLNFTTNKFHKALNQAKQERFKK